MTDRHADALRRLVLAFPQGDTSAPRLALYLERLRRHDPDLLGAAVDELIDSRESHWLPSIGEIAAACHRVARSRHTPAAPAPRDPKDRERQRRGFRRMLHDTLNKLRSGDDEVPP